MEAAAAGLDREGGADGFVGASWEGLFADLLAGFAVGGFCCYRTLGTLRGGTPEAGRGGRGTPSDSNLGAGILLGNGLNADWGNVNLAADQTDQRTKTRPVFSTSKLVHMACCGDFSTCGLCAGPGCQRATERMKMEKK